MYVVTIVVKKRRRIVKAEYTSLDFLDCPYGSSDSSTEKSPNAIMK
jgi:hypothetical protein